MIKHWSDDMSIGGIVSMAERDRKKAEREAKSAEELKTLDHQPERASKSAL